MSSIKSDKVELNYSAEKVFDKISNPENLKALLQKVPDSSIPEEQKRTLEQIEVSQDSITIPAGPVGAMTLRVTERKRPELVRMDTENSPVSVALLLHIYPQSDECCKVMVEIDNIPKMLAMMVSGTFKKMSDQFAQLIRQIPFE